MYEVVRIVNGHEITRMVGTKGFYHVRIKTGNGFYVERDFSTIKAAKAFIERGI